MGSIIDIWDGNSTIDIMGDPSLNVGTEWWIGYREDGLWTVNISGNPTITVSTNMRTTDNFEGARFIMNMGGGSLEVGGGFTWGDPDNGGGGGELNVSGGATIECSTLAYEGGGNQNWTLNLDVGTITVSGEFRAPGLDPSSATGGANAFINIDSGTLECGSFNHGGYVYAMDINEGMFIIHGDHQTDMEADVTAGYITAFNDTEDVLVEVVDGNTIVRADYVPVKAFAPSPENFAGNVCPGVELSWTAGGEAAATQGHDVYFGTDINDVTNATTAAGLGVYMGRQDSTVYPESGTLTVELGTTYYWRIDETDGVEIWTGDVWEFTINDGNISDPYPGDLEVKVEPDVELQWTSGCTAQSHDVYFGTDFSVVSDATTATAGVFVHNQPGTTYSPPTLDLLTYYYWRIDEVDNGNTYKGRVWQFRTRSQVVDEHMILWYELDETGGGYVPDSSGYEHHGSGYKIGDQWEPNDGHIAGCLNFEADQHVFVPSDTLELVTNAITLAVWLNGASGQDEDNDMVVFDTGDDDNKLRCIVPTNLPGLDVYWQAGNDSNDLLLWEEAIPSMWREEWHHFAFVKDEIAGTMKIYFDGIIAKAKTGTTSSLTNVRNKTFKIGAKNTGWSDYDGKMDDFRVYDRVLTPLQVAGLFRGSDLERAWGPKPYHGQMDVPRNVGLMWRPGDYVVSHDVYFGTDWDDVNDATTASDVYVDRRGPNEYDPPTDLTLGTTYYWRIDEVNETDPNIWKGYVWSFSVANYIVIDSFETYTSSNNMYLKWKDGWENDTGSTLLLGAAPTDPVHTGGKSQLYSYNNSYDLYYSEAERVLGAGEQDFTEAGVKVLTMYFYGKSTNTATTKEQLYAGLDDGGTYAEVRYGTQEGESITDIQLEDWSEWNVALSNFTDVTLNSVDGLFIGFGSRSASSAGGYGLVFFDDIRISPSRCLPAKGLMAADLSGNCVIDIADVGIMSMHWLTTDINFPDWGITVTEPSNTNLVGFWKMEGNGNDSSDEGNNGVPEGAYSWVTGYDGVNQAIELVNGRVLVPDHATLRPASVVSAACWVYYDGNPGEGARVVVKGKNDFEAYCIELGDSYNFTFYVGDVNGTRYFAPADEGDVRPGEWIHLGGTYDGTTVKSYVNGLVVGTEANSISLSQDTNDLAIGNRSDANDRPFTGIVDEVRVYNVALSQAEMAWLATDGTGYVPLRSTVNIYDEEPQGSRAVNFRDVAELMLSWLDEKLWPRDY